MTKLRERFNTGITRKLILRYEKQLETLAHDKNMWIDSNRTLSADLASCTKQLEGAQVVTEKCPADLKAKTEETEALSAQLMVAEEEKSTYLLDDFDFPGYPYCTQMPLTTSRLRNRTHAWAHRFPKSTPSDTGATRRRVRATRARRPACASSRRA